MGIIVLGLLCGVLGSAAAWLYLKRREMLVRFAHVIDIDREVAAGRQEVERLRREGQAHVGQVAAHQQRAEAEHRERLGQQERAATAQLAGELQRLQASVQQVRAEHAGLAGETARRREAAEREHTEQMRGLLAHQARIEQESSTRLRQLTAEYDAGHGVYLRLKRELSLLQEESEDISFGLYKPSYPFDTPEQYKAALDKVWQEQKELVKRDEATACPHEWSVGGSKVEGKRMQKQLGKLMLRAYNGESEAAIARVTWNNVTRMEERIKKAFEAINGLGTVVGVAVTQAYADLALKELRLTYEYEQKKREIAEEQREIRERLKEDEKAQREALRLQEDAAKEESRYEKALDKARSEMERANGEEMELLRGKMMQLEQSLAEAKAQKARAKSMAELTKSGYVYVISNMGSFGEHVYKIGMTRRLDPMDRVKELGDASVPFEFDVHAMVYTDDAPRLENEFHRHFAAQRVNMLNARKEFFSVSIEAIGAFVRQRGLAMQLTLLAEAREYRESVALRAERNRPAGTAAAIQVTDPFPTHLAGAQIAATAASAAAAVPAL